MCLEDAAGPVELLLAGREDAVHGGQLVWMDAQLPAQPERPGEAALLLEPGLVADVEEHRVDRRADPCRCGGQHELGPGHEQLELIRTLRQPQLRAQVVRAQSERGHARRDRGLRSLG